jgi:hypothetical protein
LRSLALIRVKHPWMHVSCVVLSFRSFLLFLSFLLFWTQVLLFPPLSVVEIWANTTEKVTHRVPIQNVRPIPFRPHNCADLEFYIGLTCITRYSDV